jgi:hypothetical protein
LQEKTQTYKIFQRGHQMSTNKTGKTVACPVCGAEYYVRPCEEAHGWGRGCCRKHSFIVARKPRRVEGRGYVLIQLWNHPRADDRGLVYEHILVMENKIGRPLRPGEMVHHADENKGNNSPENLVLMENRAAHNRAHAGRTWK